MKAMILAAGRGERLRPLTDTLPKPLVAVGPYRLIEYHLLALAKAGVDTAVINVCYRQDQLVDYLGNGGRYGLKIIFSRETTTLGTGGGVYQALPLLGDEPFVLLSADIWSQYSFSESFWEASSDIHLVLVDNPEYHSRGDYTLTDEGRLSQMGQKLNYAGIAKVHPRLLADAKGGAFSLSPYINQAVDRGLATGEYYRGAWFNVGTMLELERARAFVERL